MSTAPRFDRRLGASLLIDSNCTNTCGGRIWHVDITHVVSGCAGQQVAPVQAPPSTAARRSRRSCSWSCATLACATASCMTLRRCPGHQAIDVDAFLSACCHTPFLAWLGSRMRCSAITILCCDVVQAAEHVQMLTRALAHQPYKFRVNNAHVPPRLLSVPG
jgi:hypothetical protein